MYYDAGAVTTDPLVRRLLRVSLADPLPLTGAAASLLALAGCQLALPRLIEGWVEGPLVGRGEVGSFVATAAALVAAIAVSLFLSRAFLARVNHGLLERLRAAAAARLLAVEPATLAPWPTGDLLSRVLQDAHQLAGFAEAVLKRLVGDGALAAGALTMMFVLDPGLAALACLLVPAMALLMAGLGRLIRRLGATAQARMSALTTTLQEQLRGFTTIKSYRAEAMEADRFARVNAAYRRAVVRGEVWAGALVAVVFLLAAAGLVAAVAYGSRRVAAGALSPGGLLAFCLYAGQTVEPLRRLAETQAMLQRSLAAAERLLAVADLTLPPTGGVGLPCREGGSAVGLTALDFAYGDGPTVFAGLDLTVACGEQVAVVAASGGGKSTLAALLCRFLSPCAGTIAVDGVDLATVDLAALRRALKVVEQSPFLLAGSVADNVRYGSWAASTEAVAAAVAAVGLDAWVASDPRGLDAPLGEGGRDLSGGQRQRVALARAVLSEPAVLILDEATSALDSASEAEIFTRLGPWLARRTVIVLAHRLATVRRMGRVVVITGGRAVADGSPAALASGDPSFRALFADQLANDSEGVA